LDSIALPPGAEQHKSEPFVLRSLPLEPDPALSPITFASNRGSTAPPLPPCTASEYDAIFF
jgi:hypothetical protein